MGTGTVTEEARTPRGANPTAPAWWVASPPRVGVSRCLLGEPVRFNGGHKRNRVLGPHVEWVPMCPEVEVGMGTPRETLHLVDAEGGPRTVARDSGRDHTQRMAAFAERRIRELDEHGPSGYILKSKSPSCGLFHLPVYAGGRERHREGRGLFAAALAKAGPLLALEEESRLGDPATWDSFLERIFAHARLRELFAQQWHQRDLVEFHARHELQLLSHDPGRADTAGRVASGAAADRRPRARLEQDYAAAFLRALAAPVTRGGHARALHRALDQIGEALDPGRRRDIRSAIDAYRGGDVPVTAPVTALLRHVAGAGLTSTQTQTYFAPFPPELACAPRRLETDTR